MTPTRILADAVLVVHLLFVCFVVLGFVLVPLGGAFRWRWVRRRRLRVAHVGAIAFVALEAAVDIACPLTVWEDALRGRSAETTLMERLLHNVLYYDLPSWVFTAAYAAAAALALALWKAVPPERRHGP